MALLRRPVTQPKLLGRVGAVYHGLAVRAEAEVSEFKKKKRLYLHWDDGVGSGDFRLHFPVSAVKLLSLSRERRRVIVC